MHDGIGPESPLLGSPLLTMLRRWWVRASLLAALLIVVAFLLAFEPWQNSTDTGPSRCTLTMIQTGEPGDDC